MNRPSKIFLAAISTVFLLAGLYIIAWSCGPSLALDEARFALFRPDIAVDSSLEPFYYTERFLNSYSPDPQEKDYERNCAEWQAYTRGKATIADIYAVQYDMSADSFLNAYYANKLDDHKDNTFLQWLTKKGNKDALQYMALAKKTEQGQQLDTDAWTEEIPAMPYNFDSLARLAIRECESKKTTGFLRERYAFQAVKLWYYARDTDYTMQLTAAYNTYLKNKPTIVSAWAALYYGMSQKDKQERTRYLLYAFDRSEEKKVFVYNNLSRSEINAFEKLNPDTAYRAVTHALKAIKNPGRALADIQEVYRYSRNSRYLPLLISREVNKLEDWLLTPDVLGFTSSLKENEYYREQAEKNDQQETSFTEYAQKNWLKDKEYLKEVRKQFQLMLQTEYQEKDLIRLAIAHLYHIEGSYKEARNYIPQSIALKDTALLKQLEVERMVSFIHLNDITTPEAKEQIYTSIKRMEQLGMSLTRNYNEESETADDLAELLMLLSREYKAKGDIITAGLLHQKTGLTVNEYDSYKPESGFSYWHIAYFDRYAEPETIDTLIAYKNNPRKSSFEQYVTDGSWAEDNFYLDLKGTILTRQKRYREALQVFASMPERFWEENYAYKEYLPQNSIMNVGTLLPVSSGPATQYAYPSKKLIIQDIVKLNDELNSQSNPAKRANTYFLLGNAYYNISFFGKAWMAYSYGKSQGEIYQYNSDARWGNWAFFSFYPNSIRYGNNYYKMSDAMDMYYRAFKYAGKDKELAAKSLLMLAYCDQAFTNQNYSGETHYSKYFAELRAHYAATKVYGLSRTTCPDVSATANGN